MTLMQDPVQMEQLLLSDGELIRKSIVANPANLQRAWQLVEAYPNAGEAC